jgi:formamidopyrimidine-DNA glycosylase
MPELPDVMGFERYLQSCALHQKIADADVSDDRILKGISVRSLKRRLKGHALEDLHRRGKFLLGRIDGQGWLVLHFGMTGDLDYYKQRQEEPEYTRLRMDFENGAHLAYQSKRLLGEVGWADDPEEFAADRDLGPDAYELSADADAFRERLSDHRGKLKSTLTNQSVLAGIGNVYSDEILFQARLHPATSLDSLSGRDLENLRRTTGRVLRVCGRHGGNVDELPSHYLLPHRERGAHCPRCDTKLKWTKSGGRSTCHCPKCQSSS